ncbi:ABC transporter ATP-binding protein [Ornithinibacillus scapharcae]|uniref:ABC transporter ATP-binding protein n=1 Tax=Ornithinibacillus scapharcae TaxID=1147159 RepID=UPI000225B36A|nr:ABC transporter ATP-binding protein [Ornithinibacillus scapharcae]
MEKLIIGEHIMKSFGEGEEQQIVLNRISIEIGEGEFISVMGPSGSGKSTLMHIISGLDRMDGGRVTFNNRSLVDMGENELSDMRRREMGFVFQQPTMLHNLNILDNIILPSMRDNRKEVANLVEKARYLMKKVGILELEKRSITEVSGGQLQRAGICRSLMNRPKIVFGDEPTGALNSKSAEEIMDIFSEINKEGTAVMMVTHDAKVAARTERVLFMRDGKVLDEIKLPKFDGKDIERRVEYVTEKMLEIGI